MTQRLFNNDLPQDILHLILVKYDGRFKRRNENFTFQIKHSKLYENICTNLIYHYISILNSKCIRNEIYISCIKNNNVENIQYIVRKYVKMRNLQYLYN